MLSWLGSPTQPFLEDQFQKDFLKLAGDDGYVLATNYREILAADYIKRFSRFSDQDAGVYRVISFEVKPANFGFNRAVYYDAPFNIALWQEGCGVIAILGFDLDGDGVWKQLNRFYAQNFPDAPDKECAIGFPGGSACWVLQIQGVPDKGQYLQRLRWEKMLLAVVIDWSRANGMRFVHVARAAVNRWYKTSRLGEEGQKRLHLRYDVTAERMGFQPSKFQCTLDLNEH